MNDTRAVPGRITAWLRQAGLAAWAAEFLAAAGPVAVLGAQVAYLIEPYVGGRDGPMGDVARLLEDPDRMTAWIEELRREGGAP